MRLSAVSLNVLKMKAGSVWAEAILKYQIKKRYVKYSNNFIQRFFRVNNLQARYCKSNQKQLTIHLKSLAQKIVNAFDRQRIHVPVY